MTYMKNETVLTINYKIKSKEDQLNVGCDKVNFVLSV